MLSRAIPALCLIALSGAAKSQSAAPGSAAVPAPAAAVSAAPAGTPPADPGEVAEATDPAGEKILVAGQRPGPGLWKVSKDEHVLWVFGTYGPLPQKMVWRSQQVETILAQSQEVLEEPGASAHVGWLRGITLLPYVIGIKKNPDGATLKDVLPADVYARWQTLKGKYLGDNDGIERERPIFAAETLYRAGLKHAGLSNGYEVRAAIDQQIKKNKLKVTSPRIELEVDDPARMIRKFKNSPLEDVACFSKTLERLESDLDAMRVRANAWSKGDLAGIQKLSFADHRAACDDAMRNAAFVKDQPAFKDMEARARAAWMAAAEKALAANASTFAMLHLKDILGPQGYIAALEARGYKVESPD
ncbi:TraB/GumN family protein [Pseudoduganella sp. LjRoot289]|uniref:TraB/GumN family protein n=1 Tax=Pseudoduganella sp. LjRoot289 TaxID=3342314 RepID=UPI003ECC1FE8